MQLREEADQFVGAKDEKGFLAAPQRPKPSWGRALLSRWRRDDKESYVCYALFVAYFIFDFSIAALGFQLALFLYALLVPLPSRHFWQVGESSSFDQFYVISFALLVPLPFRHSGRWGGCHCFNPI